MRGDETIFVDFSEPSTCAIQLKWADRTVHLPLIQFYDGRYWQKLNVSNDHFPTGRELHLKIKVKNNVSNLNLEKKQNPFFENKIEKVVDFENINYLVHFSDFNFLSALCFHLLNLLLLHVGLLPVAQFLFAASSHNT